MNIGNTFMRAIALSPLHFLLGSNIGVIDVKGRKTGKAYSTPINATNQDGAYLVTSLRNRTWWRNLRGEQIATFTIGGKRMAVRGEVIEDASAVTTALMDLFGGNPRYARYFGIKLSTTNLPALEDVTQLARDRVVIKLHPL
jgi:deazaflavin-dependent oxidoreductase (nitroreductase family)